MKINLGCSSNRMEVIIKKRHEREFIPFKINSAEKELLDRFNNHGRCSAAAVANTGCPEVNSFLFHSVKQRNHNSSSGTADRVTNAYCSAVDVYDLRVKFKLLIINQRNNGKCLIDFKQLNIAFFHTCTLKGDRQCISRCRGEPFGRFCGACMASDPC